MNGGVYKAQTQIGCEGKVAWYVSCIGQYTM